MIFADLYKMIMESHAPRSYSCLMMDMSFLRKELREIQEQIRPCDLCDMPGHGLAKDFHCTALYGLHTDKASLVTDTVELKPITFKIGKISLFEKDDYEVLKFHIISPDIVKLNKDLRKNLEYTNSFPDYMPHATIAYLNPGTGHNYLKLKQNITGKTFTSKRFIFSDQLNNNVYITT